MVDSFAVRIRWTIGIQAILSGTLGPGISIVNNDLEHHTLWHSGTFRPDFDPAFSGWKYTATEFGRVLRIKRYRLAVSGRKAQTLLEKLGQLSRLG
jgi:hypothetical protein